MYSFLSLLDSLKADDFTFAQNFKHTMLHPYKWYYEGTPLESMDKIEATLVITALYKGVPIGPSIIEFTDPKDNMWSFKGVGVLNNQGKLDNTQFACINGTGYGHSYNKMVNGRPAPNSYHIGFNPKDLTIPVCSLTNKSDVSGWTRFTVPVNIHGKADGIGKIWKDNGNVYIGKFKNNN